MRVNACTHPEAPYAFRTSTRSWSAAMPGTRFPTTRRRMRQSSGACTAPPLTGNRLSMIDFTGPQAMSPRLIVVETRNNDVVHIVLIQEWMEESRFVDLDFAKRGSNIGQKRFLGRPGRPQGKHSPGMETVRQPFEACGRVERGMPRL